MAKDKDSPWANFKSRARSRMVSGMLVAVPLVITVLLLKWIWGLLAGVLGKPIAQLVVYLYEKYPTLNDLNGKLPESARDSEAMQGFLLGLASILALLGLIYLLGLFGAHVVGRKLISRGESLLMRVPVVKKIYAASKQVVEAVSLPDRSAFKSVVLLEFLNPGYQTIGFSTGPIEINGCIYCKVFVPTCPNPTTGYFILVTPEKCCQSTLTVEEGFRILLSGGILAPNRFTTGPISMEKMQVEHEEIVARSAANGD